MLSIALQESRILGVVLTLAHAAAIGIFWLIELPLAIQLGSTLVVFYGAVVVIRRHALLRGKDAVIGLEVTQDHAMSFETRSGGWQECEVLGTTYVTSWLTILNLRAAGASRNTHVTLLPDSLHPEDFRRLRTWLRWKQERTATPHVP